MIGKAMIGTEKINRDRPEGGAGAGGASPFPVASQLVDPYLRPITYLRVSVTDRCDLRCVYCMNEEMSFLPKRDLLTLEELDRLCTAFVRRGTTKLRLTGGEPLVRRDVMRLFRSLSRHLASGALKELTLTTNGTLLARHAKELADCGVRRVNVSLDTLDPARFRRLTRWGDLAKVLEGIKAARAAGLDIKINAVALKGENEDRTRRALALGAWRGACVLTLIEVMPLGELSTTMRSDQYLPLSLVSRQARQGSSRSRISTARAAAPPAMCASRKTEGILGFITPLTHNFCESCNRVRVTCTGTLYMCLGQEDAADLRAALRASPRR